MWISKAKLDDLQRRLSDLATARVEQDDKLRRAAAERDLFREQAAANAAEAREAVRMVADWLAEHQFGQRIFNSSAPSLPSETPNLDKLAAYNTAQGRTRARDLVRLGEERFLQDFREAAGRTVSAVGETP